MKTLLLLINNYDVTEDFVAYVASLCRALELNLHILHIQNPYAVTAQTGILNSEVMMLQRHYQDIQDAVRKHIEHAMTKLKDQGMIAEICFEHQIGSPSMVLNEMLKQNRFDLLALQSQIQDAAIVSAQSNFEIIRLVKCPIFVIPATFKYMDIDHAVFATDFHSYDLLALQRLGEIFKHRQLQEVIAFHLIAEECFHERIKKIGFQKLVSDEVPSPKVVVHERVENKDLPLGDQIANYAIEKQQQLVVLLKENKTFMRRILNKSFTKRIMVSVELPLLILHQKDEDK